MSRYFSHLAIAMAILYSIAATAGNATLAPVGSSKTSDIPEGDWKAGIHYDELAQPQPTTVPRGKVEVVEVFWYSCPHCYALEPTLVAWSKAKPSNVEFVRIPVTWTPERRADAKLYYTLDALGRLDLHQEIYDRIHQRKEPIHGDNESDTFRIQLAFAKSRNIEEAEFSRVYNSSAIEDALRRADTITRAYRIAGVPSVVVGGRYTTDVGRAGSPLRLVSLMDYLVSKVMSVREADGSSHITATEFGPTRKWGASKLTTPTSSISE